MQPQQPIWTRLALALAAAATVSTAAQAAPVYANNSSGDAFTNSTAANKGEAVGATGWYYNNVRADGVAGIDQTYGRSGNGSTHLSGPGNAKADIEYLAGGIKNPFGQDYVATSTLGLLSQLTTMQYEWYRSSSSAAAQHLTASLRVLIDRDGNLATTGDRGGLVFENVYNGGSTAVAVATDAWVAQSVTAATKLWNFGIGGTLMDINNNGDQYDSSLADWQAFAPNAVILGFSSGIGSGWGAFNGAVDNIGWTINGISTTSNFEVQPLATGLPEPASLALVGISLAALGLARRRRV